MTHLWPVHPLGMSCQQGRGRGRGKLKGVKMFDSAHTSKLGLLLTA